MEDDDEFGDLYTDVLTTSFPPKSAESGPPIDGKIDSDDEEILYGAPKSAGEIQRKALVGSRTVDLNSELEGETEGSEAATRVLERGKIVNFPEMLQGDDADIDVIVEEGGNEEDHFLGREGIMIDVGVPGESNSIPGVTKGVENDGGVAANMNNDDWGSEDSEDDLNIVLNDNSHMMGMERMQGVEYDQDDDDEDGEPLVILGDDGDAGQMTMEEHGWAGNEEGADGEKKEPGDASKAGGGPALMPKIGYSGSHAYHHPLHSQFKYVRPGAAPLPGSIPGQVGAPATIGSVAGRGRGDWRPAGVKNHPGYGNPGWGANTAGRGYGSGLDFTLPSHKTIFEVDIDSFYGKPWRLPGIELSDFFNFDLTEESWKDYCKQLDQLRLETTMQNKIRVVGSGRGEQDYDPDLPPELAAAVGIQVIPSGNSQIRKSEMGANGLAGLSSEPPPMPIGRPIQVDMSPFERPPSIDSRRPRMHDTDAIIEIVCLGSPDGEEKQEDSLSEDDHGVGKTGELQQEDAVNMVAGYVTRKAQLEKAGGNGNIERDDTKDLPPESDGERGPVKSPERTASGSKVEERVMDERNVGGGSTDDRSICVESEEIALDTTNKDNSEDRNLNKSTRKENHFSNRDRRSQENQDVNAGWSGENSQPRSGGSRSYEKIPSGGDEDEVLDGHNRHADDKERPEEDDAIALRSYGREIGEDGRHQVVEKRKDSSYSRGSGNPYPAHRQYVESERIDLRKEKDLSEESHRREGDHRRRGLKENHARKRGHSGDVNLRHGGALTESERVGNDAYYQTTNPFDNEMADQDMESRKRDEVDNAKRRNERVDEYRGKRMKEDVHRNRGYPEREDISRSDKVSSSRNKRAKDDGADLLHMQRRDPEPIMKDGDNNHPRQKEEAYLRREKGDRQRESDERYRAKLEDFSSRREREETQSRKAAAERSKTSHSRGREDRRSNRENNVKDVGRRVDQLKRRDQPENESRNRDPERAVARDERVEHGSGSSRAHQHKQKEATRKKKESDSSDPSSVRKIDDQSNHIRESEAALSYAEHKSSGRDQLDIQVNSTGKDEQRSLQTDERKHREDASSEDEKANSRKGRSKLERWASHKERDFNASSTSASSSLSRISLASRIPGEPNPNVEDKPLHPTAVGKKESDAKTSNDTKVAVDENKQLEAVEKLKRRSERFKLPMPSGKESIATKRPEKEPSPLAQSEVQTDSDIKPERPARKRKWTAS